jgi:hypothetical protein
MRPIRWLGSAVAVGLVASACADQEITAPRAADDSALLAVSTGGTVTVLQTSTANQFSQGWVGFGEGTSPAGSASIGTDPGTHVLGSGSLRIVSTNSNAGWAVGSSTPPVPAGTPLTDITELKYSTYRASGQPGITVQHISLQFAIDYDLTDADTGWQGRLTYEPYNCNAVPSDTWSTWDTMEEGNGLGCWWGTGTPRVGGVAVAQQCPQGNPCTWAEVKQKYPNAGFHPTNTGGILFLKVGSTWAGTFYADALIVGVNGTSTTYDFETPTPCTTTCYVDGTAGDDLFGGDTPASAKRTIQAGVNQVSANGSVIVAAGTYVTNVNLNKSLSLLGANSGVAGNATRGAESIIQGRATVNASGVRIDGFRFDGSGTNAAGIVNGIAGFSNLTIENNVLAGYTGRAATFGFSEGVAMGANPASNITVRRNVFTAMAGNAATSLAIFNTDGVVVEDNVIRNDDAARSGRRGVNLDGVRDARVEGNDIQLGRTDFSDVSAANTAAPWVVQLSMSDRSTERVTIRNNTIGGALNGIVGLSQRNLTDVTISGNTLDNVWNAVNFNGGGAAPVATGTVMSDLTVSGNVLRAFQHGVRVRNLHAPTGAVVGTRPVSFANVTVTRNSLQPMAGRTNADVNGIFVEDTDNILIEGGTTGVVAGTCNFWNAASGPGPVGPGSGTNVTARVNFSNWLTTSDLTAACPVPAVAVIDIQPNIISLSRTGIVTVYLYSTATFDAAAVDPATVRLRVVNGTGDGAQVFQRNGVFSRTVRDFDGDGRADVMLSFQRTALQAAGLSLSNTQMVLEDLTGTVRFTATDPTPPTIVN